MKLYSNISVYFFIWLFSLLIIFTFGLLNLPQVSGVGSKLLPNLANWDGGHFLGIAKFGYSQKFQYAFFPLYPVAINLVNKIIDNFLVSAVLISTISTFFALQFLYKLISLDFSKKLAEKVILLLLLFPTSFYFITAYSEGLFFLLVIASFYFFRKGSILVATVFAALASATRLVGLAVAVALIIQVVSTAGINRKNWYILFAPLGFILYCIYLFQNTGDFLYFLTAEQHWQRSLTIPGVSFWQTLQGLTLPGFIASHFNSVLDLVFAIFGIGLAMRSFRFLPAMYGLYGLLSLIPPLMTPTLSSMPRFLLPIFPIFILIGLLQNQKLLFFIELMFTLFLAVFSILFINGYWVG